MKKYIFTCYFLNNEGTCTETIFATSKKSAKHILNKMYVFEKIVINKFYNNDKARV